MSMTKAITNKIGGNKIKKSRSLSIVEIEVVTYSTRDFAKKIFAAGGSRPRTSNTKINATTLNRSYCSLRPRDLSNFLFVNFRTCAISFCNDTSALANSIDFEPIHFLENSPSWVNSKTGSRGKTKNETHIL